MDPEFSADHVEFIVKMNRLTMDEDTTNLRPVKFRQIFYIPAEDLRESDDVSLPSAVDEEFIAEKQSDLQKFIKDPFQEPSAQVVEEVEVVVTDKLGRNMRASHTRQFKQKTLQELRNSRLDLLKRQKEQMVLVEKEMMRECTAKAFVNTLLLQGFQLKPPKDAADPEPFQLPVPQEVEEGVELQIEKTQLVQAIHSELKRVQ